MSQRPLADEKRILIPSSSPRPDGSSRLLAAAALDGVRETGYSAELVQMDDHLGAFLRDCRVCRSAEGHCTIEDGFEALLREKFLPADAKAVPVPASNIGRKPAIHPSAGEGGWRLGINEGVFVHGTGASSGVSTTPPATFFYCNRTATGMDATYPDDRRRRIRRGVLPIYKAFLEPVEPVARR